MNYLAHVALLNEHLGAALSASNELVADLRGPVEDLGLSGGEHCVLLVLWTADGLSSPRLAERVHPLVVELAVDALERKGLVQRAETGGEVWLTEEGRAVRALVGMEEMSSRFGRLKSEIVALRDVLQRTVGLFSQDGAPSLPVSALA